MKQLVYLDSSPLRFEAFARANIEACRMICELIHRLSNLNSVKLQTRRLGASCDYTSWASLDINDKKKIKTARKIRRDSTQHAISRETVLGFIKECVEEATNRWPAERKQRSQ